MFSNGKQYRRTLRHDFLASLSVFLVALPLCIGVAVASGVPAEFGIVTGIVGGLIAGALPGSHLQVSGPAAGLTVLVYETVTIYGLRALGVVVLAAGLLQLLMGALRLGRWFRAISASVVHGMLAGIGLVLIVGQAYALADRAPPGSALANLAGLPQLLVQTAGAQEALVAACVGLATIALLAVWRFAPGPLRSVPAPLAAIALTAGAAALLRLPVGRVRVEGLLGSLQPLGLGDLTRLAEPALAGTVLAFALIASAESLFSAAAVDRMHDGPRTHYDRELIAQGVGNSVCGMLGALPMTAVIVRSAANVRAGARTRASRILHGLWLLLFVALAPAALGLIPLAALAGLLVHAGWKLIGIRSWSRLWRTDRGEALVLVVTALTIVATNLLEGVLVGLLLAVAKTAWTLSHVDVALDDRGDAVRVRLSGNATFLRLPGLLDTLEELPPGKPAELDLSGLRHLDHATSSALEAWTTQRNNQGTDVRLTDATAGRD
ncbi:MAG: SulP family inorganic anion transporter [Egibacteraceae bacterium]